MILCEAAKGGKRVRVTSATRLRAGGGSTTTPRTGSIPTDSATTTASSISAAAEPRSWT